MYTFKDQLIDSLAGVFVGACFIAMWVLAARADLLIVGF